MAKVSDAKRNLVKGLFEKFGAVVSRKEATAYAAANGFDKPHWLFNNKAFRAGRGRYDVTKVPGILTTDSTTVVTSPTGTTVA